MEYFDTVLDILEKTTLLVDIDVIGAIGAIGVIGAVVSFVFGIGYGIIKLFGQLMSLLGRGLYRVLFRMNRPHNPFDHNEINPYYGGDIITRSILYTETQANRIRFNNHCKRPLFPFPLFLFPKMKKFNKDFENQLREDTQQLINNENNYAVGDSLLSRREYEEKQLTPAWMKKTVMDMGSNQMENDND